MQALFPITLLLGASGMKPMCLHCYALVDPVPGESDLCGVGDLLTPIFLVLEVQYGNLEIIDRVL